MRRGDHRACLLIDCQARRLPVELGVAQTALEEAGNNGHMPHSEFDKRIQGTFDLVLVEKAAVVTDRLQVHATVKGRGERRRHEILRCWLDRIERR